MNGDAHAFPFRSWTAITAGVVLCGLGLAGLLYNLVLLTTHLWYFWVLSAMTSQVTAALLGQVSPLMLALNLSGGGWMLAVWGLQILPPPTEKARHGCGRHTQ
jgi:hypothetical protein